MSAHFAELLAGSFNRFALLIAQVNKLKSAASWVAVAHRGAHVHGWIEGRGRSSGPRPAPPRRDGMPSRARASRMESADCAAARGGGRSRWNRTWQAPGEIMFHR